MPIYMRKRLTNGADRTDLDLRTSKKLCERCPNYRNSSVPRTLLDAGFVCQVEEVDCLAGKPIKQYHHPDLLLPDRCVLWMEQWLYNEERKRRRRIFLLALAAVDTAGVVFAVYIWTLCFAGKLG